MYFVPKKPLKNGTFSIFYLGWYGLVRGSLEFIKGGNPVTFGNSDVKVVQVICYIVFIVCVVLQVLLQFGKINFETKWFENICNKRLEATSQKSDTARMTQSETATNCENKELSGLEVIEEIKFVKPVKERKSLWIGNDDKEDK